MFIDICVFQFQYEPESLMFEKIKSGEYLEFEEPSWSEPYEDVIKGMLNPNMKWGELKFLFSQQFSNILWDSNFEP